MSLRDGAWVTPARIRIYCTMLLLMTVAIYSYLGFTAHGINDAQNRPLGTDFANIYAAGSYVNEGRATAPFSPQLQEAREREIFGANTQFYGWHYPPFFLTVAGLLYYLPYVAALLLWQFGSGWFYLRSLQSIMPGHSVWLVALAYPAVFVNLGHGHNGFLTAALIGFGVAWLKPKPLLAGVCFGLLAYKPQFGVLIPLALIAGGYTRTLLSAAFTVLAMIALVTAMYGVDVWPAFFVSLSFTREVVLEQGQTGFHKIQSVFAAVRLWGGSVEVAYAVQGALVLGLAVTLWRCWRSAAADELKYAALIIACFIATPYSLDYDLMAIAPVLALLARHGLRDGFAPYEKSLMAIIFLCPLFVRELALHTLIPLAPILLIGLYFSIVIPNNSCTALKRAPSSPPPCGEG